MIHDRKAVKTMLMRSRLSRPSGGMRDRRRSRSLLVSCDVRIKPHRQCIPVRELVTSGWWHVA